MQPDFIDVEKNSLNNNNLVKMDAAACSAQKDKTTATKDEHPAFNELNENDEDLENNVFSDSDDDQFVNSFEEEFDVQLSSPPSSRSPSNSDNDQRWYAYRGRWGINLLENQERANGEEVGNHQIENRLAALNQQHAPQQQQHNVPNQQQQQEEEETDFLEMDFEPDTNSEIENEGNFGHNHHHHDNHHLNQLPIHLQQANSAQGNINCMMNGKSTGAKPKQFSQPPNRNVKSPKSQQQHATYGDNIFKITGHLHNSDASSSSLDHAQKSDEIYNIGASCSSNFFLNDKSYHNSHQQQQHSTHLSKLHKSPSKSSHHSHKQQRLHEEQNDQFLFEIEPIKPRNSVTIYTSNCDEKILMDALVSVT
jgi:hypothetical protein